MFVVICKSQNNIKQYIFESVRSILWYSILRNAAAFRSNGRK